MCYFKFGDSNTCDIKCNETFLEIKFKYYRTHYYMNYDAVNDSVSFYYTTSGTAPYTSYVHGAPQEVLNFYHLQRCCTEEGYFMEMTRQDLTLLPMDVMIEYVQMCKTILSITKEYRDGRTETST